MDFRHLRQFVVLAETLNFRKAAERLHMSQPPLSVSIRKLESELGVTLFDRSREGVRLTQSGLAALDEARRALFHAAEFMHAARAASKGERGELRVGFVGSATHGILPAILPRFRAQFPGVRLILKESRSLQIVDALQGADLDVGILRIPVQSSAVLKMYSLQRENFLLVVPARHRLAGLSRLSMADLVDEDFVFYTEDAAGLRMAALLACEVHGYTPRVAQEAAQVATLISLVEAGMGVALVPSISREPERESLVWKALSDVPAMASIGISAAWSPENESAMVKNFLGVLQDVFPPQSTPPASA
ncbi:LysR family transcriptional regulator [Castellaniella sp.]|uniref:LysR family transcriptional regulator n=1 Tax=Castellaniella sp. TaxID=1955812 RepID=UPI00355E9681